MRRWLHGLRRLAAGLAQAARLACGVPDYEAYRQHMRRAHPDQPVMDYASFFRDRQQARYGGRGGGRCC